MKYVTILILVSMLLGLSMPQIASAAPLPLSVGQCAVVTGANGAGGLAVRSQAGLSSTIIRRIPDGTVVKILGGPISKDGYTWWQHDQGGWSAGTYLADKACPGTNRFSVVLDAGHGGSDPGAVNGSLKEKDINLDVTNQVKSRLEQRGVTVYLTRSGDTNPDIGQRVQVCKDKRPNLMVSVHTNAGGGTGPEGWYTQRYFGSTSQALAAELATSIANSTGMKNRGAKNETQNRLGSLGILSCDKAPSALAEMSFIDAPSGTKDRGYLSSGRGALAQAIADGIWRQLNR